MSRLLGSHNNGSYTIAAKPIKTLELHYTMIQFLIIVNIHLDFASVNIYQCSLNPYLLNTAEPRYFEQAGQTTNCSK